jgi:drug/metabolite transporter (DMT)-like permease
VLLGLATIGSQQSRPGGSWYSAIALFIYAAGFSFAYLTLPAATGALLLFGAVQITMIGYGLRSGERLSAAQTGGLTLAIAGLVGLLLPGLAAPPPAGAALMLGAGVAWGVYSLRGRGSAQPIADTAGNFLRAVVPTLLLSALFLRHMAVDPAGVMYAGVSGALASGGGYAVWYSALPSLRASTAATVQLSVPAIAAAGAVAFLGEPLSLRLVLASLAILGGVGLFIHSAGRATRTLR